MRYANAAGDLAWTLIGGRIAATGVAASVWYSPSNTLPMNLGRPAVVTIHDLNFLNPETRYDPGFRTYAERMFSRSARTARRVVTQSEYSLHAIVEAFGIDQARVLVAYPGLEHALRVPAAPRPTGLPRRYALFVGQTEPHKNVGLLLDAWDAGVPGDLHLLIAGPPGRDHDSLLARASRGKAPDRVHFLGRVPDSLLATLYAEAACFLYPSLAEGFGFPPLEAMARGTVTAVAATTSLPEVTADGAVQFDPHDPTALAILVTSLTEDEDLRAGLISRGRSVASRYRWPTTASIVWTAVRAAEAESSGGSTAMPSIESPAGDRRTMRARVSGQHPLVVALRASRGHAGPLRGRSAEEQELAIPRIEATDSRASPLGHQRDETPGPGFRTGRAAR